MMLDERWKKALVITAIVLAGLFVVAQAIKLWAKSICECYGNSPGDKMTMLGFICALVSFGPPVGTFILACAMSSQMLG